MALAADVVTFIDLLILNLSAKFKINLLTIDNTECFNIVFEGEDLDTVVGELQKKQSGEHTLARDILKEVTGSAYDRIRKGIFNDTNIDKSKFPSLYNLTKGKPIINSGTYLGNSYTGSSTASTAGTSTTSTTSTNTTGTRDTPALLLPLLLLVLLVLRRVVVVVLVLLVLLL